MNKRTAILDLGTNTFHLLVADINDDHSFRVIYKAEEFVNLGEEGLTRIGDNAFARGIEQIKKFREVIDVLNTAKIYGFGTAAIRTAINGDEFMVAIMKSCPIELKKISGDEEAQLIYLGVRQAVGLNQVPVMIMDIGGGSTEFILADQHQIFWKKSFALGAAALKKQFHTQEPISSLEQARLLSYLKDELSEVHEAVKHFSISHLIGASGSFDSIARMIHENFYSSPLSEGQTSTEIPLADFYKLCKILLHTTPDQRLQMKGLIWFRAPMIVVAALLTAFVIESCHIRKITRSAYALKEGVLWEIIHR